MNEPKNQGTCTLDTPRVAEVLARLFIEVQANDVKRRQIFESMRPEERARLKSESSDDYRHFFGSVRELYLAVSPNTGRLLYMLARAMGARAVVEFGTSFGISTIHLAAAIRDNGGGRVIGSELEPSKIARAQKNLMDAGLADLVDVREGDAVETLAHEMPDTIDLVLLDGHKPLYSHILELLKPRLRVGACLVADNSNTVPDYLARVRAPGSGYLSAPIADDVELSIKL